MYRIYIENLPFLMYYIYVWAFGPFYTFKEDLMLDILEKKWPEILDFFKKEYDIQDITFETFILPLNVKSYKDGLVKLIFTGNSGSSGLQYINKRYFDFLKISISIILGNDIDLQILLPGDSSLEEDEDEEDTSITQIDS